MASQRIIWTALPAGTTGSKLHVSVHVSPRLTPDAGPDPTLAEFPDFLDWPATSIVWRVVIDGVKHPATVTGLTSSSSLWKKVFNSSTGVTPYSFTSLLGRRFYSYPAAFVRSFLQGAYTDMASKYPRSFPPATEILTSSPYAQLPHDDAAILRLREVLTASFPPDGGPIPPASSARPPYDLVQTHMFLQPLTVPPTGTTSKNVSHPTPPAPDFHQALSLLARHPALLRLFGIVIDLELDRPAGSFPSTVSLRAEPHWSPAIVKAPYNGQYTQVTPTTMTTWSRWLPAPRPSNPEIDHGLLRLSDPNAYEVVEMDLDGATLKTLDFVLNVARATGPRKAADTPTSYSTPSLRSAGLSLARNQNAEKLYGHLQGSTQLNAGLSASPPPSVNLYAEDLTQGYRIDVWDSRRNAWFRLCERIAAPAPGPGGYAIGSPPVIKPVPAGDEGWVELGIASASDASSTDQYLPEPLMRWAGWSLVAARPGKHLAANPTGGLQSDQHNPVTGAFPIRIDYAAAPATLPVLRFGRSYRFRARAVDVGGNSVAYSSNVSASAFKWATRSAFYGRLEPVPSPVFVPTAPRTPGEHLERLVIRSNYDIPDSSSTIHPCSRHIAPPTTSEELAEQHGVLDDSAGRPDPSLYDEIAARAGLSYKTPSVVTQYGGQFDDQPMNEGQQWLYYPGDDLGVPYLPDVFGRGAALRSLPGTNQLVTVPFGGPGAWPAAHSFRLVVKPGSAAPVTSTGSSGTTLTVKLPKAEIRTVHVSCHMATSDVAAMTLWSWLVGKGLATSALEHLVVTGAHWMFTPFREVLLVHAVRQPLLAPSFSSLSESRELGLTYCLLEGAVTADPKSSQRIDVLAEWQDPFDDGLSAAGTVELQNNARVGELALEPSSPGSVPIVDLRHNFGDTKHRIVSYEARATSRFLEYFTETATVTLNSTTPVAVSPNGFATGATVVTLGTVTYRAGVDYSEDDATGTIARLAAGSIPSGTTVTVRYVVPPVTRSSLEPVAHPPTKNGFRVSIPSSSRPVPPEVRYLIPAFEWAEFSSSTQIMSTRRGNLLRVYLGRPWWSSGAGELLGVVLAHPPIGGVLPLVLQPLVTQYGPDPTVESGAVKTQPALADFPLRLVSGTSLVLAEQQGTVGMVDIAGHTVSFDAQRRLWFADIDVEAGESYWPFVRLAFVRYQPNSLAGVEVSRVVQVDFAQLAPNRSATLTFPSTTTVSVTVAGPGYVGSEQADIGDQMRAWVQIEQAGISDPELKWVPRSASDPGTLLASSTGAGDILTWTGTVTLPAARGSQPFRILIAELDNYLAAQSGDATVRMTYFDAIPI